VKTRRSLATLLERMNEVHRRKRPHNNEPRPISPLLKTQLKKASPFSNMTNQQDGHSLMTSIQSASSIEMYLESALLSLGRCCDLVRPAGTFSAQSVLRQEWKEALRHLQDFLNCIEISCDPDCTLPAEQWGFQLSEGGYIDKLVKI